MLGFLPLGEMLFISSSMVNCSICFQVLAFSFPLACPLFCSFLTPSSGLSSRPLCLRLLSFKSTIPGVTRLIFPKLFLTMTFPVQYLKFLMIALRPSKIWFNCFSSLFFPLHPLKPMFQKSSSCASDIVIITLCLFICSCSFLSWNFLPETCICPNSLFPWFTLLLFHMIILVFPWLDMVFTFSEIPCLILAEHSWLYMAESSLAQKGNLLEGLVIMEKEEGLWVSRNPIRRLLILRTLFVFILCFFVSVDFLLSSWWQILLIQKWIPGAGKHMADSSSFIFFLQGTNWYLGSLAPKGKDVGRISD